MQQAVVVMLLLGFAQCEDVTSMEELRSRLGHPFNKVQDRIDELEDRIDKLNLHTQAIMKCGFPKTVHYAEVEITASSENSFTAAYTCQEGYTAIGDVQSSCLVEDWSEIDLICFGCDEPLPVVANADVTKTVVAGEMIAEYNCFDGYSTFGSGTTSCNNGIWTPFDLSCRDLSSCFELYDRQAIYSGTKSTTEGGKTCQLWSKQWPQSHSTSDADLSTTTGLRAETLDTSSNYCRDPDRSGFPWCYTTNIFERWQKCDVQQC